MAVRFVVQARDLRKGLRTIAILATPTKNPATVDILAAQAELTLRAPGVTTCVPAVIETPGSVELPGAVFSRIHRLRSFPKGRLTVSARAGEIRIQSFSVKHPEIRVLNAM